MALNFNPGNKDIQTGIKDEVNGRFAVLGWAKEFKVYGSMTKTFTWTLNDTTVSAVKKGGGRK